MKSKGLGILVMVLFFGLLYQQTMAGEIVINWSGGVVGETMRKCYFEPFEKATGHKVFFEQGANFAKLRAMVKAGNVQWDAAEAVSRDLVITAVKDGILERIDYTIIETKDLYPVAVQPYCIGQAFYSTVLAYNAEKFPKGKEPQGWKDFWDVKRFPGPRSLQNDPFNNLEFALMADGVPPDKLYPLDLDRAFRSLDRIKPHVKVWWTAGAQPAQLLTDREVDMASAWNGRIYAIQKEGVKVAIQWNQGILLCSDWVVPKGAKNAKLAMEFINFTVDPKRQACWTEVLPYPGPNKKLFDYLSPEVAPNLPTYPENYKKQLAVNDEWWVENRAMVQDRWNAWMIK